MVPHQHTEDQDVMEASRTTEVQITATSQLSFEDAIAAATRRATASLRGVQDARITDQQVLIEEGNIVGYKVNLAVTFIFEDDESEPSGEGLGVVLDPDEYRRLSEAAEELEDLRAYDEAVMELKTGEDELVPWEIAEGEIERERDELRRRGEL
jgi:flavin-binding protein dodecin